MTWQDFTISFATPAFLGVDPQHESPNAKAEPGTVPFPISSLRGTLRYWLRALVGAHVGNTLAELHRVETEVFGAASGRVGQPSRILLRARTRMPVEPAAKPPSWLTRQGRGTSNVAYTSASASSAGDDFDRQHLRYLLGQGLYDPKLKRLTRRHTPASDKEITLAVKNQGDAEHATLFLAAMWALRTFGGLGARVHRGFGTVVLRSLPDLGTDLDMALLKHDSRDDLPQILTAVGRSLSQMGVPTCHTHELARYPHFDLTPDNPGGEIRQHHRCADQNLGRNAQNFADALSYTGKLLRDERTFNGAKTDEYDEIVNPYLASGRPGGDPFLLGAYGLPVGFSDPFGPEDNNGKPSRRSAVVEPLRGEEAVRRSSPLWLRVRNDGNTWSLRSLAFYSEWLPDDSKLRIRDTTDSSPRYSPQQNKPVTAPSQGDVEGYLDDWFR